MNLEDVSAGKSTYNPTALSPKPIQLSLFPKKALRPDYCVSIEQIERIMDKMSADGLCGKKNVRAYLRRQLRHNCWPNTIRGSGTTILSFLNFLKRGGCHF